MPSEKVSFHPKTAASSPASAWIARMDATTRGTDVRGRHRPLAAAAQIRPAPQPLTTLRPFRAPEPAAKGRPQAANAVCSATSCLVNMVFRLSQRLGVCATIRAGRLRLAALCRCGETCFLWPIKAGGDGLSWFNLAQPEAPAEPRPHSRFGAQGSGVFSRRIRRKSVRNAG